MKRILCILIAAFAALAHGQPISVLADKTTRLLVSPTNFFTVNAGSISNALGLAGMAVQAPASVSITGGTITGITDLAVADGGTGASTAAGARTNLGLTIGSDVQAYDSELAAIAGLTSAADTLPYFSGSGAASTTTLTTYARSLLDDADAATARTTLGAASTAGTLAQFGSTTSAELAGVLSNETGTGSVVFSAAPTFTGQVQFGDGTVSAPGIRFGDADTGFYQAAADRIYFALGGVNIGYFNSSSVRLINGSASAPSYTFTGSTSSGLYHVGSGVVGITSAGVAAADVGNVTSGGFITLNGTGGGASIYRRAVSHLAVGPSTSSRMTVANADDYGSNYDWGGMSWSGNVFRVGTENAGTYTTARDIQFLHGGTEKMRITSSLVTYGGTSSSFPAHKRNGATIETVLADGSAFAAVQSLYVRFGSGSPEGVVTAPVGAMYSRTDGGAGTSLYVKESGTGNTGWVAK